MLGCPSTCALAGGNWHDPTTELCTCRGSFDLRWAISGCGARHVRLGCTQARSSGQDLGHRRPLRGTERRNAPSPPPLSAFFRDHQAVSARWSKGVLMTVYSQHANRGKTQILATYQGQGGVEVSP